MREIIKGELQRLDIGLGMRMPADDDDAKALIDMLTDAMTRKKIDPGMLRRAVDAYTDGYLTDKLPARCNVRSVMGVIDRYTKAMRPPKIHVAIEGPAPEGPEHRQWMERLLNEHYQQYCRTGEIDHWMCWAWAGVLPNRLGLKLEPFIEDAERELARAKAGAKRFARNEGESFLIANAVRRAGGSVEWQAAQFAVLAYFEDSKKNGIQKLTL